MKPVHPPPVDEFDLELLEAGAEISPERAAQILAEPSLQPARDELAAMKRWWEQNHRPLPALGAQGAQRSRRWGLWGVSLAAAAAALLWLALPEEPAYRPMGRTEIDVLRLRAGEPVEPSERVLGGDELALTLVPEGTRFVSVATLQEDGAVSLLVASEEVAGGQRFEVPGRIALDSYQGREWLVVLAASERDGAADIEREIRGLLPDPVAHAADERWVIEVTRGRRPR